MQQIDGTDDDRGDEPTTKRSLAEEPITYEDMKVLCFGLMDPCDWAATLSDKLSAATRRLREARDFYTDPAKDITQFTEADALAAIRSGVGEFLAELHVMLASMPVIQSQPQILESLRFILAGVTDIDRGAAPEWLAVRATKCHPKRLAAETEWVPVIAALELLLLDEHITSIDAASKYVQGRTGRALGTIKDWHRKLYVSGKANRPAARAAINEELSQMRECLKLLEAKDRADVIKRRVSELLN